MINEIMTGITVKLDSIYGDTCRYYGDRDEIQDLEPPCFFVSILNHAVRPVHDRRYRADCLFDIAYFPGEHGDNAGMHEIGDRLFQELEYITLADGFPVRGRDMSYEIVDGVLHFQVSYSGFYLREAEETYMEDLEQIHSIKTGE